MQTRRLLAFFAKGCIDGSCSADFFPDPQDPLCKAAFQPVSAQPIQVYAWHNSSPHAELGVSLCLARGTLHWLIYPAC